MEYAIQHIDFALLLNDAADADCRAAVAPWAAPLQPSSLLLPSFLSPPVPSILEKAERRAGSGRQLRRFEGFVFQNFEVSFFLSSVFCFPLRHIKEKSSSSYLAEKQP